MIFLWFASTFISTLENSLGYFICEFPFFFRFIPHLWKRNLCTFIRMVDIIILLPYLPSNVSDNLWRSLWYISCKIVVSLKMYVFCGQQNHMFFSFHRQTVFKAGIVFYLAIWEVFKQGSTTRLLNEFI